jgi:transposase
MAERRQEWDAATRARLVAAAWAPGSSAASVARAHGLKVWRLYGWRRQLRAQRDRDRGAGQFVPVVVADDASAASTLPTMEIALAGGRVVIRGPVAADVVGAVVAALK